jgi:Putative restriction endonuclease
MASASTTLDPAVVINGEWEDDHEYLVRIPSGIRSLEVFRKWAGSDDCQEKLAIMYLRGEVTIDLSKEDIRTHADVKTEVSGVLWALKRETDFGKLYINGVLLTNEVAGVSNNPDMLAVFWESLEKNRVHFVKRGKREVEIVGSPDWALEIVSRSSVDKDKRKLRKAYHRAGIREYWIIDARHEELSFVVLYWRKNGYVAAAHQDGWVHSQVFQRDFRLTRSPDRFGTSKYTLDVRSS